MGDLRRVTKSHPCPICGKDDWCGYNDRVVICMRIPSNVPTHNGGWLHKYVGAKTYIEPEVPETVGLKRDDNILDRVYRKLLSLLPLYSQHQQHLYERGINDDEIERFMYRSLPANGRDQILSYFAPEEVERVPGFGTKRGHLVLCGRPGLIIPVISPEGKIVALMIRPDKQEKGKKYILLSSAWLENGASPGARLHMAVPAKVTSSAVWITEGPLKANIAASRLGAKVLAVPGVSNWGEILNIKLPRRVVLAYDTDYENYQVRYHARKLANALLEKGVDLRIALWNGFKGLDDALVGGAKIRLARTTIKPLPEPILPECP